MNDKQHILTALLEEFNHWEGLLAGMSEAQLTAPRAPSEWSVKDHVAHLFAWQQRSIARMEAAVRNTEPDFADWPTHLNPESEDDLEQINAWIYATNRDKPWPTVHGEWRDGYLRLVDLGATVPEPDLLQVGRYSWLKDYPLALVLDASREHHEEHREELVGWLRQHGQGGD